MKHTYLVDAYQPCPLLNVPEVIPDKFLTPTVLYNFLCLNSVLIQYQSVTDTQTDTHAQTHDDGIYRA